MMDRERLLAVAKALGDPARLSILDLLRRGRVQPCCSPSNPGRPQALCACDLLGSMDMAPSRLSYHLRELREAGLIGEFRSGRWIYYSLEEEGLRVFLAELERRFLEGGEGPPRANPQQQPRAPGA